MLSTCCPVLFCIFINTYIIYIVQTEFLTNYFHIFSTLAVCANTWFRLVYHLTFCQLWIIGCHIVNPTVETIQTINGMKTTNCIQIFHSWTALFELECDYVMLSRFKCSWQHMFLLLVLMMIYLCCPSLLYFLGFLPFFLLLEQFLFLAWSLVFVRMPIPCSESKQLSALSLLLCYFAGHIKGCLHIYLNLESHFTRVKD